MLTKQYVKVSDKRIHDLKRRFAKVTSTDYVPALLEKERARAAAEGLAVTFREADANWTPDGFIGQLFKTIGKHVPPPAGLKSPAMWGTEDYLRELFGDSAARIQATRKSFNFRYASAAYWLQVFRDFYGPVNKAFAAVGADGESALKKDLLERFNIAGSASLVVPGEYLEVVMTRRSA